MTTAVIDTSVLIKFALPEDYSDIARNLIEQHLSSALEFSAPEYILVEAANVLWKRVRRDHLLLSEAARILRSLRRVDLQLVPESQLLDDALLFAADANIAVYDALFCVLARQQQVPLITADLPLVARLRNSPIHAITLDQIPW